MVDFINKLDGWLWGTPLIVLMFGTGLFLTIRSGFFQIRYFGWIFKRTIGTVFQKSSGDEKIREGMLTPFEAVCIAIGGTVGFGNIAGVATAVASGGPGALFWMWLCALFGMILKQVEVALGCYYRMRDGDSNDTYGGPTYYMEQGLGEAHHWGKLWKIPAILFGFGIVTTFFFTSGTLTTAQVVSKAFLIPDIHIGGSAIEGIILVGAVIVVIEYLITSGGFHGVANIFSKLVPFMSILYLLMGIGMILSNITRLPIAIGSIFSGAFTGTAALGGFAGAAVSKIVSVGLARSVYSNEAGWGTSPMIHSTAKTSHPVEQGLWGSFEVFFDTMVVCTITGLSTVLSGQWTSGDNGGALAVNAFSEGLGNVGAILLAIIMIVFTVTTAGGWFTYYMVLLKHVFKRTGTLAEKIIVKFYLIFRFLPGLFWCAYLVKTNNQGFVWTLVDVSSAIPTFINVFVVLMLSGDYFKLLKDYKARNFGIGKLDPHFALFYEDKLKKGNNA